MVTVLIPIYNEEKILLENLNNFKKLSQRAQLIFIDGGSKDKSVDIAGTCGMIVSCKKGRAAQMNHGASFAKGNILFFLHADNIISKNTLQSIEDAMSDDCIIAGCLTQRINRPEFIFRFIESQGNFRARTSRIFYGDQGIFIRKDVFLNSGGFPEVPIMEDVLFTRKLRKMGKSIVLPDKILVSARRWEKKGIFKTVLLYNLILILFWMRVPLGKIKPFYDDLR